MDSVNNQMPAHTSWCAFYALVLALTAGCAGTPRVALETAQTAAPAAVASPLATTEASEPPAVAAAVPAGPADLWDRVRAGFALQDSGDPRVASQLQWFAANQAYLDRVVTRAQPYFHYIVEEVEKRGMPMEVALLPIVESAFDPFAYSHGRAAGLWQFIPGTGRRYQLKQDWWYDGRRDVVESTRAALDYLQDLHLEFNGDWLLALASYNVGEGRVAREVRRNLARGKPTDFWNLNLPRETSAYVPKLLALKRLVAEQAQYGVQWTPVPDEPYLVQVELPGQIDLAHAAGLAGLPVRELYLLNPGFNRFTTPPDGPHLLVLPRDVEARFRAALAAQPLDTPPRWGRHRVQRGDTLLGIAQRHGTSVAMLKSLNDLSGNLIHPGQNLLVPGGARSVAQLAPELRSRLAGMGSELAVTQRVTYTAGESDTLWRIAREHGITAAQLARWNGIDLLSDRVAPGDELVVWDVSGEEGIAVPVVFESVSTTRIINYVVRRGDNLWTIAKRFGTTAPALARLNRIKLDKPLRLRQRLRIQVDVTQQSSRS